MLNQSEKAHELIDYFMGQQRPRGWYHWAEVVWNSYRTPAFIGDMPHTWVGSDLLIVLEIFSFTKILKTAMFALALA